MSYPRNILLLVTDRFDQALFPGGILSGVSPVVFFDLGDKLRSVEDRILGQEKADGSKSGLPEPSRRSGGASRACEIMGYIRDVSVKNKCLALHGRAGRDDGTFSLRGGEICLKGDFYGLSGSLYDIDLPCG